MIDNSNAFDSLADEYDSWFDSPKGRVLFNMELEALRQLMTCLRKPFLEIGTGTGRFAVALGIDAGIDPAVTALKIAEGRGIKVKKAMGEELPFDDKSFGAVFIMLTLCFADDLRRENRGENGR